MPTTSRTTSRLGIGGPHAWKTVSAPLPPGYCDRAPPAIERLTSLGHGRAAQVHLVRATWPDGQCLVCVEKVFRPAFLTRLIYRLSFQAPFAYQFCEAAVAACFYRRRVAAAIVDAMLDGVRVAHPLYVRWDDEAEALVLGTEFVDGRGVRPQATDPHMLRRWLAGRLGRPSRYPARPSEEIRELLAVMTRLENLFRECGLTGSAWQVCKRAVVSTANLLRTPEGYVVVDLESGIPAVLVPSYLLDGIRLGSLPLFDDLDPARLDRWLEAHRQQLWTRLGPSRFAALESDVRQLIAHIHRWKHSELALLRNKWRIFSSSYRERFKARCLELWRRRDIVDESTEAKIRPGRRIFTRWTFLLGLLPGAPGRFLQRLWANRSYRAKVRSFFSDREFRSRQVRDYVRKKVRGWRERGRVASSGDTSSFNVPFVLNFLLAPLTPPGLHRWLSDPVHRRIVLVRMFLICVSSRFQSEYGRHLIRSCIRRWDRCGRLTPQEVQLLDRQLSCGDLDEYVRCFGMHLGLKLLLPLLAPLKVGGAAAFLVSGNWLFLALIMLLPVCRTMITVWRMLSRKKPAADYIDALLVGTLPVVGSLAYPVQMYSKFPELSSFLLRDSAACLGRWLPIYGGKDSRLELWAIKMVNLLVECLEIFLAGTAPLRRRLSRPAHAPEAATETIELSAGRWHNLVDEQLALIALAEAADKHLHDSVERSSPLHAARAS